MYSIVKRDFKKSLPLFYIFALVQILLCIYSLSSINNQIVVHLFFGIMKPHFGWQYSIIFCFNTIFLLLSLKWVYEDLEKSREFIFLRIPIKSWLKTKAISFFLLNLLFHCSIFIFVFITFSLKETKLSYEEFVYVGLFSLLYHMCIQLLGLLLYYLPYKIGLIITLILSMLFFIIGGNINSQSFIIISVLFLLFLFSIYLYVIKTLKVDRRNLK